MVRRVFGGDVSPLKVKGHDDLLVYRARCCNPIRGEEIIGYVTRGKGVAVHSKSCPNVENLMYEPERRIAVEWGSEGKISAKTPWLTGYPAKLVVLCDNRPGMLKQITAVISDANTNIRNIGAKTARDPRHGRHHRGYRRRQAPGAHHLRRAEDPRRARSAASAEALTGADATRSR